MELAIGYLIGLVIFLFVSSSFLVKREGLPAEGAAILSIFVALFWPIILPLTILFYLVVTFINRVVIS